MNLNLPFDEGPQLVAFVEAKEEGGGTNTVLTSAKPSNLHRKRMKTKKEERRVNEKGKQTFF